MGMNNDNATDTIFDRSEKTHLLRCPKCEACGDDITGVLGFNENHFLCKKCSHSWNIPHSINFPNYSPVELTWWQRKKSLFRELRSIWNDSYYIELSEFCPPQGTEKYGTKKSMGYMSSHSTFGRIDRDTLIYGFKAAWFIMFVGNLIYKVRGLELRASLVSVGDASFIEHATYGPGTGATLNDFR